MTQTHDNITSMDYHEHDRTYHGFLKLIHYGSLAVAVILILMAIFLL